MSLNDGQSSAFTGGWYPLSWVHHSYLSTWKASEWFPVISDYEVNHHKHSWTAFFVCKAESTSKYIQMELD